MRNKLSYIILLSTILLFNCKKQENLVFDNVNGQTLISFGQSTSNLRVVINDVGSVDIPINVSTVSNTDRTARVSVVSSTAPAGTFSVPATVVIPAGSYNGTLTVSGTDTTELTTEQKNIQIKFDSFDGSNVHLDSNHTINIFQVCPVQSNLFVGRYSITVNSPGVFRAGTYGATGTVVELSVGATSTQRVFRANYFNDTRFNRQFILNFVCNTIEIPYQDHNVGCGGNSVNLSTGPATNKGIYSTTDDSSFTVILTDNVDSDCGGSPVEARYTFTKL